MVLANIDKLLIRPEIVPDHFFRVVGRPVIYDDHLDVGIGLTQGAVDRATRNAVATIVGRNNDADYGVIHAIILRRTMPAAARAAVTRPIGGRDIVWWNGAGRFGAFVAAGTVEARDWFLTGTRVWAHEAHWKHTAEVYVI